MKRLFALWLLAYPVTADPIVSGDWTIDAQPVEDRRARVEACYQEASQEDNYWRARLDDKKVELSARRDFVGPLQTEVELEQSWQTELEQRRAQVTLSIPDYHGWATGLTSRWDYAGEQWSTPQLRGWVATPELSGWSARGELTTTTDSRGYLARLCKRIGRGELQVETAVVESEHLQRRWLARYQWNLTRGASFSTSGSRTRLEGTVQDKVEATLEVHF
ncbi:MAG: hypothetical protein KF760_15890 [Candidatus Eremiobacteraeota bacterium]|nr:hypothetical protein [Candidatus Eremiobacteraeota bacterium]MCW5867398.1 hypothetical protein [Candidatus Eremiobacteraeota bacterium]